MPSGPPRPPFRSAIPVRVRRSRQPPGRSAAASMPAALGRKHPPADRRCRRISTQARLTIRRKTPNDFPCADGKNHCPVGVSGTRGVPQAALVGDCPGKRPSARRERPFRGRHRAGFGPDRGVRGKNQEQRAARDPRLDARRTRLPGSPAKGGRGVNANRRPFPFRRRAACDRHPSRSSLSQPVTASCRGVAAGASLRVGRGGRGSWSSKPMLAPFRLPGPSLRLPAAAIRGRPLPASRPVGNPASIRAGRAAPLPPASGNFHRLPGPGPARPPSRSAIPVRVRRPRQPLGRSAAASMPAVPSRSIRPQIVAVAEFRRRHD